MAHVLTLALTVLLAIMPSFSSAAGSGKAAWLDLALWDVARSREERLATAVHALAEADVILVGESHDDASHHAAQMEIIRALHISDRPVAVGLEAFQHRDQKALDAWVASKLSLEDLRAAFARNWEAGLWPLYAPIFEYARQEKIPLVGLNVPREITRQVARQGFSSLSREQLGQLPPVVCIIEPEYEAFLRRMLGEHAKGHEFQRFCEAQLVWDTAMAYYAGEFRKAHAGSTLVVLTGSVHAWKRAMPAQLRKLHPELSSLSVLPATPGVLEPAEVGPGDADYLYRSQASR